MSEKNDRCRSRRIRHSEGPVVNCISDELVDQPCLTSDRVGALIGARQANEFVAQREHAGRFATNDRNAGLGERGQSIDQLRVVSTRGVEQTLRSEEHTSELQSRLHLVCRLLLEKKKNK